VNYRNDMRRKSHSWRRHGFTKRTSHSHIAQQLLEDLMDPLSQWGRHDRAESDGKLDTRAKQVAKVH
jgi:hypothetical protein